MRNKNAPLYAVAAAILFVGLAFAGVPASTPLIGLLVLACLLSMLFMMRGMYGGQGGTGHNTDRPQDKDEHHPTGPMP